MRRHWREVDFWRWWWRYRLPLELKIGAAVAALVVLAVGGYLASHSGAKAASTSADRVEVVTLKQVETVRGRSNVVRRVVPVVRRVVVRADGVTNYLTRTLALPGTTRLVTTAVVRRVRVLEPRLVTVDGRPRTQTVVKTRPGARQTVTAERVTTAVRTVTDPQSGATTVIRTVTEQGQGATVTKTVTADPVTSTRTVTSVQQTTVSETTTVQRTETVTTTAPAVTVTAPPVTVIETVTLTIPKGKP
jgi:hypothetical protein